MGIARHRKPQLNVHIAVGETPDASSSIVDLVTRYSASTRCFIIGLSQIIVRKQAFEFSWRISKLIVGPEDAPRIHFEIGARRP